MFHFLHILLLPWLFVGNAYSVEITQTQPNPKDCRKPLLRLYRESTRSPDGYWTPGRMAEAISVLRQAGISVAHSKLDKERELKVTETLLRHFDYAPKLHAIYRTAERLKRGVWKQIVNRPDSDWNLFGMEETVRELNRRGMLLTEEAFRQSHSPDIQEVIHRLSGKKLSELEFYHALRDHYPGGWDVALKALGIKKGKSQNLTELNGGRRSRTLTDRVKNPLVAEAAIKALYERGVPIHPNAINSDNSPLIRYLIWKTTGYTVGGARLYAAIKRHYPGGWMQALKNLKIDPSTTRTRTWWEGAKFWTPEKVQAGIQALHSQGVSVNSGAIQFDTSEKTKSILRQALGSNTTGSALFEASRRLSHKGWDETLRNAGLDPWEIRKTIWATMRLSEVVASVHTGARVGNDLESERVVGKAPDQPEEVAVQSEMISLIEQARQNIPVEDQPLFDSMMDLIYGSPEKLTPPDIAKLLSESEGVAISEEQVSRLMAPLREKLAGQF